MTRLPYSQACENNKPHILAVLREVFADRRAVLEIGSGTAQHATFFAENLPHLTWQPTDMAEALEVTRPRCAAYEGDNLAPPLALDVTERPWPVVIPHAVFSANSLHIMSAAAVEDFFAELGARAPDDTVVAIYGPFNYGGEYTSESNARFDEYLRMRDSMSGIRDRDWIDELTAAGGMTREQDSEMPANNRLIVWRKSVV